MLKLFDIYACIVFTESYQSSFLTFLMPQSSMFLVTIFLNYVRNFYCMQVSLLNQEIIVEKIQTIIELRLRNSNESRTFQEQVF